MDKHDPHKGLLDTIDDVSKKAAKYDRMRWISVDNLAEASMLIKQCKLEDALTHVQIAQDALKEMYERKKDPFIKHILAGVGYVQSLLFSTKDSQNAADHASRIGGMLEVAVIIMRG